MRLDLFPEQALNIADFLATVVSGNTEYESLEREAFMLQCALGLKKLKKVVVTPTDDSTEVYMMLDGDVTTAALQSHEATFESLCDAESMVDRLKDMMQLSGFPLEVIVKE